MDTDIKVYTVPEVKDILHVSQRTIYNYITMGQLKAVKLGREWRVTEDALKDFLARGTDQNYLDAAGRRSRSIRSDFSSIGFRSDRQAITAPKLIAYKKGCNAPTKLTIATLPTTNSRQEYYNIFSPASQPRHNRRKYAWKATTFLKMRTIEECMNFFTFSEMALTKT